MKEKESPEKDKNCIGRRGRKVVVMCCDGGEERGTGGEGVGS